MQVLTPGTTAPISILPTDSSLRPDCTIFCGSKTISPFARFSAIRLCSCSCRSFPSTLTNQRDDSTFTRVIKPNAIGNVAVGSVCASEVSVKNASESNTVGGCDSLESNMDEPTNIGSCVSGGMAIVKKGRQRCSVKSSLRRAIIWPREVINVQGPRNGSVGMDVRLS